MALERTATTQELQLGALSTRVLEPNIKLAKSDITRICNHHMQRVRDRQEPVVVAVLDEEIRAWAAIWRGVAGLFNKKVSLAARIKKRLDEECAGIEDELARIMNDMVFGVSQALELMLSRVDADLPRQFAGPRIEVTSRANAPPRPSTAPPIDIPSIPDELLRSLSTAMTAVGGKQLGSNSPRAFGTRFSKWLQRRPARRSRRRWQARLRRRWWEGRGQSNPSGRRTGRPNRDSTNCQRLVDLLVTSNSTNRHHRLGGNGRQIPCGSKEGSPCLAF